MDGRNFFNGPIKNDLKRYDNIRIFFDRPIKNDLKRYDNITKIATGQGDD